jgi:hypothetical protein
MAIGADDTAIGFSRIGIILLRKDRIRLNAGGPLEIEAEKSDDGKRSLTTRLPNLKVTIREWFH